MVAPVTYPWLSGQVEQDLVSEINPAFIRNTAVVQSLNVIRLHGTSELLEVGRTSVTGITGIFVRHPNKIAVGVSA